MKLWRWNACTGRNRSAPADARTRARLLLEILMAERARGGNKAFLQRADGIRGLMSSSAFLPALEEWLARVAPPPAPPKK